MRFSLSIHKLKLDFFIKKKKRKKKKEQDQRPNGDCDFDSTMFKSVRSTTLILRAVVSKRKTLLVVTYL